MDGVHLAAGAPNAYIHAPGLLRHAGEWIGKYGDNLFIVTGHHSWLSASCNLTASLRKAGLKYVVQTYGGECTYEEVEWLKTCVAPGTNLIIGVGGGKIMDTAKTLSNHMNLPFVAIPTISSTCAAVTNVSVMYTEDGVFLEFVHHYRHPLLILVDTELIASAPVQYLISGIGDTVAKWYEVKACTRGKSLNLRSTSGLHIAKLCYDTLVSNGRQAVENAKDGILSEALEHVIDAIILFGGLTASLGGKVCSLAAAHAIHNALTAIPESHQVHHGYKVAYGVIVQLILENRPEDEIRELLKFYRTIGLPATLNQMGISRKLTLPQLQEIARISLLPESTMSHMPFPITQQMVVDAMIQAEALA